MEKTGIDKVKTELIKLLEMAEPPSGMTYGSYFDRIADLIMNHCIIQKGSEEYEIVEIEFYLFDDSHKDVITYPRNIKKAGRWFFHPSGVDITFGSNDGKFGGILLRGMRSVSDGKLILGPLKCVDELWDNFDTFNPDIEEFPRLTTNESGKSFDICRFKRWIPITDAAKRKNKLSDWIDRINKESGNCIDREEAIKTCESLVFDSYYRYFSIPIEDLKGYSAKPKLEDRQKDS